MVGSAVALALARRGASVALLEAGPEPGRAASGTNSGILHTGFDSVPGELETELVLRAAALRDPMLRALGVPVLRCGALVRATTEVVEGARRNGVEVTERGDGLLAVPGESVTDPAAYTIGLAAAARRHGAHVVTGFEVASIRSGGDGVTLEDTGAERIGSQLVINCAGLYADRVARLLGDDSFAIYPRKGEFLVFDPPRGEQLERILLPAPTRRTKGVLVFPTVDGKVIAGPTAVDQKDKEDWSVRPGARDEILPRATDLWPPLEGAEEIAAYAGLRPAGRGVNYLIEPSRACNRLVNVAAIRSTGLTAALGIAEHVCTVVSQQGVRLGPEQALEPVEVPPAAEPWWQRAGHR